MDKRRPPRPASWLLALILRSENRPPILGDYEEMYDNLLRERGPAAAGSWYWSQTLKSLPMFIANQVFGSVAMFRNYAKIAWRNILKNKGHSVLNIAGLAAGLAAFLLISAYVWFESSFDRFHDKAGRIARVEQILDHGDRKEATAGLPAPVAKILDFPEVEDFTRFCGVFPLLLTAGDRKVPVEKTLVADGGIFRVFSFPLSKGNPESALRSPNSVVLTAGLARKLFGDADPLGRVVGAVNAQLGNKTVDVIITGVIDDIPPNSHLQFEMLMSESTLVPIFGEDVFNGTGDNWAQFYVLLRPGSSLSGLDERLRFALKRIQGETSSHQLYLRPLTRLHLTADVTYEIGVIGSLKSVRLFAAVALFVLLIAGINFVNLTTARSASRAKEVGLRKVCGAGRSSLVQQFLSESVLTISLAAGLALFLVRLIHPAFRNLLGRDLRTPFFENPAWLLGFLVLILLVGGLAGLYPAFILSSFRPVRTLKGILSSGSRNATLRKSLVVLQFVLSTGLIIVTCGVLQQVRYLLNKDLGFRGNQVLVLPLSQPDAAKFRVFRTELLKNPRLLGVCNSDYLPYDSTNWTGTHWEGGPQETELTINNNYVDEDFIATYKMTMVEGRGFSREFPADRGTAAIINETAARAMSWKDPIGKKLYYGGDYRGGRSSAATVVGIVKDFHLRSLHYAVTPFVMFLLPEGEAGKFISVKVSPEELPRTLAFLEDVFRQAFPDELWSFRFAEEDFQRMYQAERRTSRILSSFGLLAVLIACLGLFALASFSIRQRTKEIGVRKVLGAQASRIAWLLAREYIVLVAVANLVAWPAAYTVLRGWLQNYPYRTGLQLWIFAAAGLTGMILALMTVGFHSIRAASETPVKSLRYE